jgi:hypothetical protein
MKEKSLMHRSYSELVTLKTFKERYNYLRLRGNVGVSTFGFDRYLNQTFYRSSKWRNLRHEIIIRDEGCDLGVLGHEIHDMIVIHHMNPLSQKDIEDGSSKVFNPDGLICTSHITHMAIHYGDESLLPEPLVERRPGDTTLW